MAVKTIFLCRDHIEGIFTGIYDGWDSRLGHENIKLAVAGLGTMELFAEYVDVIPDSEKAAKVASAVQKRLGSEAYEQISMALLSEDEEKANAVYHTIVAGFAMNHQKAVMGNLSDPYVYHTFQLARSVGNESHLLLGFVRFQELNNGILYAGITPRNHVLTILAPHFADRLPQENWVIHDKVRQIFLVHEKGRPCALVHSADVDLKIFEQLSENEHEFQRLWKGFCKSISIRQRENRKLQQQNLPLRFQTNMVEFQR